MAGDAERIITFTPEGGDPYALTDWPNGVHVLTGNVAGHVLPPYEISSDVVPGLDGSRFRAVRATTRVISLPMWIEGSDRIAYRERVRTLIAAIAPDDGRFGWLQFQELDGNTRRIWCMYQNGLQGTEDVANGGRVWWRFVLEFLAMDPWWYGDTISHVAEYGGPVPFFPTLRLSASQVAGDITLLNPGDVAAWPRIIINGPGENIMVTYPSGETLALTGLVPAGSELIIETQPGRQSIRLDGVSWWDRLTDDAALDSLPPGMNVLSVGLTGATASSLVTIEFEPRYRTPL